ncbi:MAG: elongation factor G, partial [Clostridia bacterium]|nr:elongation factor G [Clostridia bacterium]
MGKFTCDKIRNVAVLGHGGEGKTTLCEAILYNAKSIDRLGKVTDGTSAMDFDEQEIARKISLSLSLAYAEWNGVKINLIDVPGFFDFEGETIEAMTAADCGVIVIGANGVVPVGAEKAMRILAANNKPAMIFINGMDKENANYLATYKALDEAYPRRMASLIIPIMVDTKMKGYVSVLDRRAFMFADGKPIEGDVPAEYQADLDSILESLVETAAENDEELLEKFFEEGTLSPEEIKLGISKGIQSGSVIPVFAGSALNNKGVFVLMDELVAGMPCPPASVKAKNSAGEAITVEAKADAPFVCRVFKTFADPFVGKLNFFKVFAGSVKSGVTIKNVNKDKTERVGSVLYPRGKKQETADEITVGDIGAFAKLAITGTGDTLCDPSVDVRFDDMVFPRPVYSMCVMSAKTGDEDKVFGGFNRLMEEDVTFTITKNTDTGETLLNGLGETHLDVLVKRLKSKFNAEAVIKTPRVPYRETIRKKVDAEGKHKKQSGGHGQYGHCKVRFEPFPDGDFEFGDEVVGGEVPRQYIPAVEKGLREKLSKGVLAGCPVVNLRAVITGGSYHDVDSSEEAFKVAAHLAFKDGLSRANPVLLEPIYSVVITVPESYIGDIMGDLNKRRGRILGMDAVDGNQQINAEVPLAEMFRYATDLRSMTQGRGSFYMEEARYEEVPQAIVT